MNKYYLVGIQEDFGPFSMEELRSQQVDSTTLIKVMREEEATVMSEFSELSDFVIQGEESVRATLPHWGNFQDDGMKPNGFRQYSAILWDIPNGQSWENACANTPATINGFYFPRPTRCINNGLNMWGQFDFPDRSYFNNWLNFRVWEFYVNKPGDIYGRLEDFSDWLTQINNRLGKPNLFKGLQIRLVPYLVNNAGESLNPEVRLSKAGCTNSSGVLNFEKPLSHEIGHIFHQRLNINYSTTGTVYASTPEGQKVLNEYRKLRSIDYTKRTPELERFAEDFKWFFGSNGAINDPTNEDDFHFGKVRAPNLVPGLRDFFLKFCNL